MNMIGITGPIGAGKSLLLAVLGDYFPLNADTIYHECLQNNPTMCAAIAQEFPSCVTDGQVNRAALGAVVFADSAAMRRLETVTHPFVVAEIRRRIKEHPRVALEAIALMRSPLAALCERTVCVTADAHVRLHRIMTRNGLTEAEAQQRIAAQPAAMFAGCDVILHNNGKETDFYVLAKQELGL